MRVNRGVWLLVCLFLAASLSVAQSPNGTISGIVLDPSGGVIVGADVLIINNATGVEYPGKANGEGYYVVPNIPPGTYRIQVSNSGFKTIIKPDIVIHVEDALAINFTLPIGAASEIVTVEGGAPLINTENAAVSTVVDREYVQSMPLNGRSFQDLILLTPGVVTNSPQTSPNLGYQGEFSVNGQRAESNYYTVDGVSANLGIVAGGTQAASISGSLPSATALGTTQGLVSVDALQEFRVQSSTYSAEYGRNPGGQFSFVTRSGTNDWHGTAFDYLRNNFFDANNWFNDYLGKPEPALRQNDFGGTLGGPIELPRLYSGKDRTFFFVSYEGLRLTQPQPATIYYVPDRALRQATPTPLQQVMNTFPVANGPDQGNGLAEFIGTWSNPSRFNSTSVRLDHSISETQKVFFRFSDTESSSATRGGQAATPSMNTINEYTTRTYTAGVAGLLSNRLSNDFRINYSSNQALTSTSIDDFAGSQAVDLAQLQGITATGNPAYQVQFDISFGAYLAALRQGSESGVQKQWNIVDTVSASLGRNQLKFGIDFRRLSPSQVPWSPYAVYLYFSESSVETNSIDEALGESQASASPRYSNFSAFVQDEWRVRPRLNLSMGLRWEVNPAPTAASENLPYTVQGASDLSMMTLAPRGTSLWRTTWFNFAPRLGTAFVLSDRPGYETVVRGGGGVFFDTGQQVGSEGYGGPGFSAQSLYGRLLGVPASFPLTLAEANPPIVNPPVPHYGSVYAFYPHLQLPYTLQWNVSIGQALGRSQAFTLSYVGSHGSRLLEENEVNVALFNPNFSHVYFFQNGLTSDYNALQAQFQRRLSHGLQALASYTWSHSFDYGSYNFAFPYERADSDFDLRNSFTAALTYEMPSHFKKQVARAFLQDWVIDNRLTVRTGFPVTLNGNNVVDPGTGELFNGGLNLVPGMPIYLHGSQFPGGRAINPAAFALPPSGQFGDAPRNFVRGFGAWQMDFAVRREFSIYETLKLQFRAEAFNIFNHPNFGTINTTLGNSLFGQATATLNSSLGVLSPIYQTGGPRSMQFALKVMF